MQESSFNGFPEAGISFLQDLAANNNRGWFEANRKLYKAALEAPGKEFLAVMETDLTRHFDMPFKGKIFRLHRDLRFSKDKTPYNTHLRMAFFPQDSTKEGLGFYFSLEAEGLILGGGVMGFSKPDLSAFRQAVVEDRSGTQIEDLLTALTADGFRLSEPELKRVPAGFDRDHPREALLRRKSLTLWRDLPDGKVVTDGQASAFCLGVFLELRPVFEVLKDL